MRNWHGLLEKLAINHKKYNLFILQAPAFPLNMTTFPLNITKDMLKCNPITQGTHT